MFSHLKKRTDLYFFNTVQDGINSCGFHTLRYILKSYKDSYTDKCQYNQQCNGWFSLLSSLLSYSFLFCHGQCPSISRWIVKTSAVRMRTRNPRLATPEREGSTVTVRIISPATRKSRPSSIFFLIPVRKVTSRSSLFFLLKTITEKNVDMKPKTMTRTPANSTISPMALAILINSWIIVYAFL